MEDRNCLVEFCVGVCSRIYGTVEAETPCEVVVFAVDEKFVAVAMGRS